MPDAEPITLYVAIWHDTDGYTYDCDVVLGIFSTRAAADECCLKDNAETQWHRLEDLRVDEHKLGEPWE